MLKTTDTTGTVRTEQQSIDNTLRRFHWLGHVVRRDHHGGAV